MNQQQYMEELAHSLRWLPAHEREQELAEIRAHLDASTKAAHLRGYSEPEAEAHAIEQFGQARKVGAALRRVWWREQAGGPHGVWKAAVLAVVFRYALYGLLSPLTMTASYANTHVPHGPNDAFQPFWSVSILLAAILPSLIAGILLARLAPRNAVAGATLGSAFCFLSGLFNLGVFWYAPVHDPLQAAVLIGTTWAATRYARKPFATVR